MIIFVKTRHHYDSYMDFWRLVELSGFPTCYVDEIDISTEACYIFTPMNGEVVPHLRSQAGREKKATIVWWFLELFGATPDIPVASVVATGGDLVDRVWVSDEWTSTLHPVLEYVRMGSHPGLGGEPGPRIYDFTHQSYAWGQRKKMYGKLKMSGLLEGPSCFGTDRHAVLTSSKLILNLHQHPGPVNAALRFALAAAYHLPIVSETVSTPDLLEDIIACAPYSLIPGAVRAMLEDAGDRGERAYQKLCEEWTFRRCVEASV